MILYITSPQIDIYNNISAGYDAIPAQFKQVGEQADFATVMYGGAALVKEWHYKGAKLAAAFVQTATYTPATGQTA